MSGHKYTDVPLWKNVLQQDWDDWHWQVANRIQTVETLSQVIHLTDEQKSGVVSALSRFRMAITPYYATLIDQSSVEIPFSEKRSVRLTAIEPAIWTTLKRRSILRPRSHIEIRRVLYSLPISAVCIAATARAGA